MAYLEVHSTPFLPTTLFVDVRKDHKSPKAPPLHFQTMDIVAEGAPCPTFIKVAEDDPDVVIQEAVQLARQLVVETLAQNYLDAKFITRN